MAGCSTLRANLESRRHLWRIVLVWIALAMSIITPGKAYAIGGISVMSSIPLSIANVMKEKPARAANAASQSGPLAAIGAKTFNNALYDPLTKDNAAAEPSEKKPPKASPLHEDASYKVAATQSIDALQSKAASLMATLGLMESGKTNEMRQSIDKSQVQSPYASIDKALGLAPAGYTNPAQTQPPITREQPQAAHIAKPTKSAPTPSTLYAPPAPAPARPAATAHAPIQTPPQQAPLKPSVSSQLTAIATPAEAGSSQVRRPVTQQGPTPVAGPAAVAVHTAPPQLSQVQQPAAFATPPTNMVRLPVQNVSRNSVVLDLEAETRARETLTEEVKKALLPVTGELSAVFESGKEGVAAIGYDRMGGTSYGKYQIASRTGMMQLFMKYLDENEPVWSDRLRKSGPANTSSRWGGMPSEWKKIAAEDPKRFESMQDNFIMRTNYEPAANHIEARTALNVEEFSPALKEVLLSTAVQHGPNGAARIFANAAGRTADMGKDDADSQNFDKRFIEEVYRVRKLNFQSSTPRVRDAVKSRLNLEQQMAITLLDEQGVKDIL